MPRRARISTGGLAYHILNRRVGRLALFDKPADYMAFEKILNEVYTTMTKTNACLFFLIIVIGHLYSARSVAGEENGLLKPAIKRTTTDVKTILGEAGLKAFLYIDLGQERFIAVTEQIRKGDLPLRRMSFYYGRNSKGYEKTHEYVTVNSFVAAYPTTDRTRLITIWEAGSAYRLEIFLFRGPNVGSVLSVGWKAEPEFADIDGDDEMEILVARDSVPGKEPESADAYTWDGTTYVRSRTLPWLQRFAKIKK